FPERSNEALGIYNLSRALDIDLRDANVKAIGCVIVSGDFTWRNSDAEFDLAKRFLVGVRSWSTVDYSKMLTCTGNHDLKFVPNTFEKGTPATVAAAEAKRGYSRFYEGVCGHPPNEDLSSGRRLLLGGTVPVDIVCLNTSLLEQVERAFQGQGFVGDGQLRNAAIAMDWLPVTDEDTPRTFRILVLHHHLVPVTFREIPYIALASSVLFDAEAVVRWIVQHRVDLVLHGHMHQPFIERITRPILGTKRWHSFHVASVGSVGVAIDHLGDE